MFSKILVANRGEIAVRAFRAATELGAKTVAVFPTRAARPSTASRPTSPTRSASPAPRAGLPRPREHRPGRRRVRRRRHLPGLRLHVREPRPRRGVRGERHHVHRPPGIRAPPRRQQGPRHRRRPRGRPADPDQRRPDDRPRRARRRRRGHRVPVFVKAVSGGGGRGMRRVDDPSTLRESLEAAQREADAAFGDPTLYLEQAVVNPGTSRCRCSPTPPARCCTSSSATARCSAATRRSSRSPRPQPRPGPARPDVRGCRALRRVDRLRQRRHRRVPPR